MERSFKFNSMHVEITAQQPKENLFRIFSIFLSVHRKDSIIYFMSVVLGFAQVLV